MALTATQKVTASEAAREPLEEVEEAAAGLSAEQETAIAAELVKYEEVKDKIKLNVKELSYRTLLEEIRQRIRKHFGWALLPSELTATPEAAAYAGGLSRSGKRSAEADGDRVRPAFRRDLFGRTS